MGTARAPRATRKRFGAYATRWSEDNGSRLVDSTKTRYAGALAHATLAFGEMFVDAVHPADLRSWMAEMRRTCPCGHDWRKVADGKCACGCTQPYGAPTVNGWLRVLRVVFDDAVADGIAEMNPACAVGSLPEGKTTGKRPGQSGKLAPTAPQRAHYNSRTIGATNRGSIVRLSHMKFIVALALVASAVTGCKNNGAGLPEAGLADGARLVDHSSRDAPVASEMVTCVFNNASGTEHCASQGHGCEGKGRCTFEVSSLPGQTLTWASSCGGQATTTTDGKDESVQFDCALKNPVTEVVTCLFVGNSKPVSCTSVKGSCNGTVSCQTTVTANQGAKLRWRSTCPGSISAWSVVDGKDKTVTFPSCGSAQSSETVTCVFNGSVAEGFCATATTTGAPLDFSCKGVGSCAVRVSGKSGQPLTWKSSCDGYAFTVIDGVDENAEFACGGK